MGLLLSLPDDELLVIDTSIVINLNATGCAEEILRALPQRVMVLDVVADELDGGRPKGRRDAEKLGELIKAKLVTMAMLGEHGLSHFERLVVGAGSETLDDGEAATIAYALEVGGRAMVDERKATRICASRFPKLSLGCTVDLVAHQAVQSALGAPRLADAVHTAMRDARMRVLPHHMDWVVALIGDTRASECRCLPDAIRRQAQGRL
jgi:predicted nucleic acid-binding protein